MSDPMVVRPVRRGRFAIPVLMLLIGVALGVGLDRAWVGYAPALGGKPKIVGKWIGVSSNDPIEFNADGTYAWEIPIIDANAKYVGGNRQVTTWKWIDDKTIELGRGSFGRQNVKLGVTISGDLLRLSEETVGVLEYKRK